jgi:ribosomal protein L16 Arg81 hydroxylase
MNYHGKLYGKVGNKYAELGVGTEYVDSLKDKIDALEQQTTKLQADKDKMAELLGEIMTDGSIMEDISEEKAEYYKEQISQALSECGH